MRFCVVYVFSLLYLQLILNADDMYHSKFSKGTGLPRGCQEAPLAALVDRALAESGANAFKKFT